MRAYRIRWKHKETKKEDVGPILMKEIELPGYIAKKVPMTREDAERFAAKANLNFKNAVHFGHPTHKWNPKMRPYLYDKRNYTDCRFVVETQQNIT